MTDPAIPITAPESPVFAIEGLTPSQCAILARARTLNLYRKMRADMLAGMCPFCQLDPTFNVVIAENPWWHAWQSRAPEKGTKHHFIIAPKRHVKAIVELSLDEWTGLARILEILDKMHGITSSGIQIRDGDARLSAGTIEHLHAHKMVPDGTVRVESPFFKGAKSEAEGIARAIIFEKLWNEIDVQGFRQEIVVKWLSEEELALVRDRLG